MSCGMWGNLSAMAPGAGAGSSTVPLPVVFLAQPQGREAVRTLMWYGNKMYCQLIPDENTRDNVTIAAWTLVAGVAIHLAARVMLQ